MLLVNRLIESRVFVAMSFLPFCPLTIHRLRWLVPLAELTAFLSSVNPPGLSGSTPCALAGNDQLRLPGSFVCAGSILLDVFTVLVAKVNDFVFEISEAFCAFCLWWISFNLLVISLCNINGVYRHGRPKLKLIFFDAFFHFI